MKNEVFCFHNIIQNVINMICLLPPSCGYRLVNGKIIHFKNTDKYL